MFPSAIDELPKNVPVVMLNLLRFKDEAQYPRKYPHPACSGAEAYQRYSDALMGYLAEVDGEVLSYGKALSPLIAPDGEDWDAMLLVRYPSADAFKGMMSAPGYHQATVHRTAALDDSRLIACETTELFAA
jgi:uncharacterized protein (DUF1330 family)